MDRSKTTKAKMEMSDNKAQTAKAESPLKQVGHKEVDPRRETSARLHKEFPVPGIDDQTLAGSQSSKQREVPMEDKFMLRSIKQLYGNKLGASDGDIGQVKDFYFDDQSWAIRYLVADTGTWLPGRQVLISPYSLGCLDQVEKVLRVNLTRKQIENSPSIEARKPVSRQYEEEYYRYFGWPYYWQGDALWGLSGFPILELPPKISANEVANIIGPQRERPDVHLRSAQAVIGYQLWTREQGVMGYVCDFMLNDQSWAIGQLAIKTGHRFSGKEVLISAKDVDRISYDESTIFATLTGEALSPALAPDIAPTIAAR